MIDVPGYPKALPEGATPKQQRHWVTAACQAVNDAGYTTVEFTLTVRTPRGTTDGPRESAVDVALRMLSGVGTRRTSAQAEAATRELAALRERVRDLRGCVDELLGLRRGRPSDLQWKLSIERIETVLAKMDHEARHALEEKEAKDG